MDYIQGQIVKAKAGRDKDGFFIIKYIEGEYAYIIDGRSRKIESPKKKKLIHLAATKSVAKDFSTNREVRRILSEFEDNI